jgi:GH15 family glucan-1,4-alpha-glucosidase
VEKELLRDGFVLRYNTEHGTDGLPGKEGAFLACSFWLADAYAFAGRMEEAEELFQRLLGLRNHLGLLSEEYDPNLRRQIGNFPHAFSHLALIGTAHDRCVSNATARTSAQWPCGKRVASRGTLLA